MGDARIRRIAFLLGCSWSFEASQRVYKRNCEGILEGSGQWTGLSPPGIEKRIAHPLATKISRLLELNEHSFQRPFQSALFRALSRRHQNIDGQVFRSRRIGDRRGLEPGRRNEFCEKGELRAKMLFSHVASVVGDVG